MVTAFKLGIQSKPYRVWPAAVRECRLFFWLFTSPQLLDVHKYSLSGGRAGGRAAYAATEARNLFFSFTAQPQPFFFSSPSHKFSAILRDSDRKLNGGAQERREKLWHCTLLTWVSPQPHRHLRFTDFRAELFIKSSTSNMNLLISRLWLGHLT